MGFRTLVLLHNDLAHEWGHDPELGQKIQRAMNYVHDADKGRIDNYGSVVECTHADNQTLFQVDSYHATPVAHSFWSRGETDEQVKLKLLRDMADRLGYRLVKKGGAK